MTNATLLGITRCTGTTGAGDLRFSAYEAIGAECFVDSVTSKQRYALGVTIQDATQTLYLEKSAYAGAAPANGDIVTYQIEGESQATGRVITLGNRTKDELSHWEIFLEEP